MSADSSFEACLDGMVDGVLINRAIRDENGRIVDFWIEYANEAASTISGVAHEELVGHRILDLFPGRRENGQFDAYVRVVETGEPLVRNSIRDHEASDRSDPSGFGRDFEVSVTKLGDGYVATLHDIVARRRAEDELMRAQQKLRLVLDTIPQRVFWKDTESVFVDCNAAFAHDAGLAEPAEIVGKTDHDLPWREFADEYAVDDQAILSTGRAKLGYDEGQVRADGGQSWVRVSKVPLLDGDDRVVGLLGTYEDITARKRAEEALRESEQLLSSIVDNVPAMVFVKDARDLRFVRVNRAEETMLGYSRQELVGKDDAWLVPPDEAAHFTSVDRQVLASRQISDTPEELLTTRHHGQRILHTTKIPILDEDGEPKYLLGISDDITERKRAEQALRESERFLTDILENIPTMVFVKDALNLRMVRVNRAAERAWGLSRDELIGADDRPGLLPEETAFFESVDRRVVETGETIDVPEEILTLPHIGPRIMHTIKMPILDDKGRPRYVLGISEDITERKQAERALRDSERFLSDILENIPTMVFVKDARDLRFVRVNRAAERTMGYSRDELVGVDDQPLAPPEETAAFAAVDRHVVETGETVDVPEEALTVPNLGRRIMHTIKMPILDDQGRPRYVLGISEDITDLKAAEEARRESEERYRHIIDTITDYVLSVTIEHGQVASMSHGSGCVAVTGYSPAELFGDPGLWFNVVVDQDREVVMDQFHRTVAGERTGPLEHRIRRKDGAVRWVRSTPVLRFGADGSPIAYDGVIQDISERRALIEQLLQSQKMEGIGRLAGGVAHDFNNLLTAILGYVEMCKLDLPPDLPADHPARLDLIEVALAGERAANLTRQLLAFASRQIVAPVRLDLSVLVADLLKMLQRLLGEDIEIETSLDPGVGTIGADAGQMQQLLVNLTVNARDAMPDGGRLFIETADQTIDEDEARVDPEAVPGQYVLLTVTDTGVGMDEEIRSHLFEPFFTTKELGKGTGLGLATCHGIVRQMGGYIRVSSEPGRGTTFCIYLPRKAGAADPQPTSGPPRPSPTGAETVLVVEDEPTVRRLAVLGLRAHGYVVLEASGGAEAIETANRVGATIDVVVSDVMMPGMSGPELLNRLSTIAPQARAVLMSGHAESTVLSPHSAQSYAFLPKPFTPERLARKVREVLDAATEE